MFIVCCVIFVLCSLSPLSAVPCGLITKVQGDECNDNDLKRVKLLSDLMSAYAENPRDHFMNLKDEYNLRPTEFTQLCSVISTVCKEAKEKEHHMEKTLELMHVKNNFLPYSFPLLHILVSCLV